MRGRQTTTAVLAVIMLLAVGGCSGEQEPALPPPGAAFDYQLGGDYPVPAGSELVVRQWSSGEADPDAYSVCYVNAFQTEAEDEHPDGAANWPAGVVLEGLEDPEWPGEHPIDISTDALRGTAVEFVTERFEECADRGYDAVELDNLDTFVRFPDAPFGRADTIAYARSLVEAAAAVGLATAQKNTPELLDVASAEIGFGFAIVEQCGQYEECQQYVDVFDGRVYDVEYSPDGLAAACEQIDDVAGVVQRDLMLTTPDDADYARETC